MTSRLLLINKWIKVKNGKHLTKSCDNLSQLLFNTIQKLIQYLNKDINDIKSNFNSIILRDIDYSLKSIDDLLQLLPTFLSINNKRKIECFFQQIIIYNIIANESQLLDTNLIPKKYSNDETVMKSLQKFEFIHDFQINSNSQLVLI